MKDKSILQEAKECTCTTMREAGRCERNCTIPDFETNKGKAVEENICDAAKTHYEENIDNSNIPREHYEYEIQTLMVDFANEWQSLQSNQKIKELEGAIPKWKFPKDAVPHCWESGSWDGKKSDPVIVETVDGKKYVAVVYSGTMDGSYFVDWYTAHDEYEIKNVFRWMQIPY